MKKLLLGLMAAAMTSIASGSATSGLGSPLGSINYSPTRLGRRSGSLPHGLGRNQRKIRKRLRQVPQLRNSKKFSR